MTRYYFDIHDDDGVSLDEEGRELKDLEAAEVEAALSLAGMAQAELPGRQQHRLAVQVRTAEGPVFEAAFIFEVKRLQ